MNMEYSNQNQNQNQGSSAIQGGRIIRERKAKGSIYMYLSSLRLLAAPNNKGGRNERD